MKLKANDYLALRDQAGLARYEPTQVDTPSPTQPPEPAKVYVDREVQYRYVSMVEVAFGLCLMTVLLTGTIAMVAHWMPTRTEVIYVR